MAGCEKDSSPVPHEHKVRPTSGAGATISISDISIYCDDQGQGDPVVLLHGGIMDHQSWGNQIPVLSRRYRVISPDTRGHGRTTDSPKPFSYWQFAEDLIGLLNALNLPTAHLVGLSDGGCTALLLGIHHPERVSKLVLLGTPYHLSNYTEGVREAQAALTPERFFAAQDQSSAVVEVVRKCERLYPTEEAWRAYWKKLIEQVWVNEPRLRLEDLARIQSPTLILHGDNEALISKSASLEMTEAIPGAVLSIVPEAGHASAQENPEFVNASIMSFLEGR